MGRQNWDIDIDQHGVVYFGNSKGLLYNVYGEWGLATMTTKGVVRAVLAKNDTVWCGGDEYVKSIETKLNNRPRKRYNFETPIFVMEKLLFNQEVAFMT